MSLEIMVVNHWSFGIGWLLNWKVIEIPAPNQITLWRA